MVNRRQFLAVLGSAAVAVPAAAWWNGHATSAADDSFPVRRTEAEWRALLSPAAYRVLRGHSTERPFSSPLDHETRAGRFDCAGCGHPLFASSAKFDSGTGWPSFSAPLDGAVGTRVDTSWFMVRTEVHCARCGGHLGHVFGDGPAPTGLRYCMNGVALRFVPAAPGSGATT